MHRSTGEHKAEPRDFYRRVGDRSGKVRGVKDTPRRPTESINLRLWGLKNLGHQPGSMQEIDLDALHVCSIHTV